MITLHENTLNSIKKNTDPDQPDLMADEPQTAHLINQTFNNSLMLTSKKEQS